MSWMQKLCETYKANENRIGDSRERPPLLPVLHTYHNAHVEVVLSGEGEFRRARVLSKEEAGTIAPCTETSMGRSGTRPASHPLSDRLQYLAADFAEYGGVVTSGFASTPLTPHDEFSELLDGWCNSPFGNPKVRAVLAYVRKRALIKDLLRERILGLGSDGQLLEKWEPDAEAKPAVFDAVKSVSAAVVRWAVEIHGELRGTLHDDPAVWKSWTNYRLSLLQQGDSAIVCDLSGQRDVRATMHPKKILRAATNAKLISSDDKHGFTYRGRFVTADEACSIGLEFSQKAHSALSWLAGRLQAFQNGTQAVVSWAVSGKRIPDPFANSLALFSEGDGHVIEPENTSLVNDAGQAFALRLRSKIAGYRAELGPTDEIVVLGLDSATPGRMAVTFQRELTGSEFLDRINEWHDSLAWIQHYPDLIKFIGAPAPLEIARAAFGRRLDDKLSRATVERLLPCIVDRRPLPRDLVEATRRRASNRGGMDQWEWERTLGIACSLFRGSYKERRYRMALELERRTREYLYGRLLAIAEHIEGRALFVAGESRDTTAARLMQRFSDRPYSTWLTIEKSLQPYKTRLQSKRPTFLSWTTALLDQVHDLFLSVEDYVNDRPLSGEYLLGYHCQRSALRQGPSESEGEEEPNNAE